eukprot:3551463-Rhodomonas_salina.1
MAVFDARGIWNNGYADHARERGERSRGRRGRVGGDWQRGWFSAALALRTSHYVTEGTLVEAGPIPALFWGP